MRRHALFLVNPACLVAAIAFVYLPGCSPNPQGPRTNPNPQGVDSDDMYQFSSSIAEAKKRGTLISEVEIIPNVWNYAGKEITFEEAWLERMPKAYFARPFALCIRINQGKEVFEGSSSAILVAGEKRRGFWGLLNRKGVQLFEFLDSEDLTHLRASLLQDYDEERQKNIRFVRKDKKAQKSDVP